MAVVPGLKCVWSRQVKHSVHKPETYLHIKMPQFDLVRHALDIATGIVEAP